jgi:hypothetical protein
MFLCVLCKPGVHDRIRERIDTGGGEEKGEKEEVEKAAGRDEKERSEMDNTAGCENKKKQN